jgi:hypothetical protein
MTFVRWLVLAVIGCGGASPSGPASPSTTSPPTTAGACIPVVPLRLLVLEHGREWEPIAALQADGVVLRAKGGAMGRIANDQVTDMSGQPVFTCVGSELRVPGQTPTARFEPNGDLVDKVIRIHVEPTGEIFMVTGGHPPQSMGRVEGPQQSPRTAAVLVLLTLANANWSFQ